jgi:arylformamidase
VADGGWIDVSRLISEDTAVWPGDTRFSRREVMTIRRGASCNVSTFTLSAHTGAHADAPAHFVEGAPTIDAVPIDSYVGPCRVVLAGDIEAVRAEDLEGLDLADPPRILFRTPRPLADEEWRDDFTYLSPAAARILAAARVRLVGIDTPSMDPMRSKVLEAHKILLGGGVALLEGLDLRRVEPGLYDLVALPLRIRGADAAPVRAALRRR